MIEKTTWDKLEQIICDVMDDDDITLTEETTAADVEAWDSVTHVMLIVEIEKQFDVNFSSTEIPALKTIGDLVRFIENKKA